MYIITHGYPAQGKTTTVKKIKEELEKQNFTCAIATSVGNRDAKSLVNFTADSVNEDIEVTRQQKDASYLGAYNMAKELHEKNNFVIVDATNHKEYRRNWLYDIAQDVPVLIIHIQLSDQSIVQKILDDRKNSTEKEHVVDDISIYNMHKKQTDNISEIELNNHDYIFIDYSTKTIKKNELGKESKQIFSIIENIIKQPQT
jgi:tRNA uridine 5-carbamoylmethylation protein Kti12